MSSARKRILLGLLIVAFVVAAAVDLAMQNHPPIAGGILDEIKSRRKASGS